MKANIKNPKAWAEQQLKKMIAKHIISYMDKWLEADDIRAALEQAREEMLTIAYDINGEDLIEDSNI